MTKFIGIVICSLTLAFYACSDEPKTPDTHTHNDGSAHADHEADTIKPQQEEFNAADSLNISADSSGKPHVHGDGKEHTH